MTRLAHPEELGAHLEENARAWAARLDGVDTSPLLVLGRVEALARAWAALHREQLAPFGLNYAELSTLGMLCTTSGPNRSPGSLRKRVGQTSAGMTRILDKLESEGLVRRLAHPEDGRRVEVSVTRRGARLAETCLGALLEVGAELLAGLDKHQRDALVLGIDALLQSLASRDG